MACRECCSDCACCTNRESLTVSPLVCSPALPEVDSRCGCSRMTRSTAMRSESEVCYDHSSSASKTLPFRLYRVKGSDVASSLADDEVLVPTAVSTTMSAKTNCM